MHAAEQMPGPPERRPRSTGARATIDQRAAARLAAVVGDGEFGEQDDAAGDLPLASAGEAPDLAGSGAAGIAAMAAALACLWAGNAAIRGSGGFVAHAALPHGSLTMTRAPGGPRSGAAHGPGGAGGDTAMKFRESMRAAALATGMLTAGAGATDAVQWRVADGGNGHWYQVAILGPTMTGESARLSASAQGGYLVSITSAAEDLFIQSLVTDPAVWGNYYLGPMIGMHRAAGECWNGCWDSGEAVDYTHWHPGNPDVSLERCVYIYERGIFNWQDYSCDLPGWGSHAVSAVVEWSADCNADGIVDYGQIRDGTFADANTNGVPDLCECATHPELGACRCAGDVVNDGTVNGADLGTLLAYWGPTTSGAFSQASDINDDGRVDGSDLGVLLANWGPCQYSGATVPPWATLIEALPDAAVVTDPALRTAIAATGLAWRVRDTGTGIEMLLVPPGTFQMGCSAASNAYACNPEELPVHQVTLTGAFYLGRYEVTQAAWVAKMGSNPSRFQGQPNDANRPVEQVSFVAAESFMNGTGLRLPTEAEWEYACRAGSQAPFYNGATDDGTVGALAWYGANSGNQTHVGGGKSPNALGLNDMLGNVAEWVKDYWNEYPPTPQVNPIGPASGSIQILRGGTWGDGTDRTRSSARLLLGSTSDGVGFRVARNP